MKKLKLYGTYYIVINKFNNYSLVKSWLELKFTKTNFIILLVLYWFNTREGEREKRFGRLLLGTSNDAASNTPK